jgi:hypothetical protein
MRRNPPPPKRTQAQRIYDKFGGALRLYEVLKEIDRPKSISSIYRWNCSKEKGGTGGCIPSSAIDDLRAAARIYGVFLTEEDFDPRPR